MINACFCFLTPTDYEPYPQLCHSLLSLGKWCFAPAYCLQLDLKQGVCTCTVTPQCLQQTPWPLLLCFSPKALRGIEATSPWSGPVCVCSCRTCPVHARAACISCSSEPAAGTWAGKAAWVQRRVKKTATFLGLGAVTNIGAYERKEAETDGGPMCEESVTPPCSPHTPPSLPPSPTWALTHECCDTQTCIDTLKCTRAMHG